MTTRFAPAWPVLAAGLFLAAPVLARDWSQFRGPGGLGVAADSGLPATWSQKDNVAWKAELPGPGTSSPAVVGGKVFLTCYTGYAVPGKPKGDMAALKLHVVCLDAKDGRPVWAKEVAAKLPEQETIREGHGYASSTPAVDAERVYVFFGKTGVLAFDHAGNEVWRADVGSRLNGWGSAASPVLYKDLVLVNASVESEALVALDRRTGKEVWRAGGVKESWATPVVVPAAGGDEVVVPIFGKVLGMDTATGKQLWSCATDISWYMVPTPAVHDGVAYVIGGRTGGALAVRAGGRGEVTGTHRVWTGKKGSNVSSPVYHDGHLYWAHDNQGIVYCAEAKTGRVVYEQKLDRAGQFYASAVTADGKVYYLDRSGKTFVVAAKPAFELLATNDLRDGSAFNATPAVAGGRLYVRSDRYLYCLGRP